MKQRYLLPVFFVILIFVVGGMWFYNSLAVDFPIDTGTPPPTQTTTPPPVQTPSTPPPQYQVQEVPPSFKPTAVPPGNNVAAPLNNGPESQSKAGALSVGSFSAGAINSGAVTVSGDLNLGGVLNIQGLVFGVKTVNAGEDSYYGYLCRGYDLIMYDGSVYPWGVKKFKVNELETCNSDYTNPYACSTSEDRVCYDVYVDNGCLAGKVSATNGYMGRNITCKITRILTQQ